MMVVERHGHSAGVRDPEVVPSEPLVESAPVCLLQTVEYDPFRSVVAGGGVEGMIQALRDEGRIGELVGVGLDLAEVTRSALIDGVLQLVLSHPLRTMAASIVDAMARAATGGGPDAPGRTLLPFEIYTPGNV